MEKRIHFQLNALNKFFETQGSNIVKFCPNFKEIWDGMVNSESELLFFFY